MPKRRPESLSLASVAKEARERASRLPPAPKKKTYSRRQIRPTQRLMSTIGPAHRSCSHQSNRVFAGGDLGLVVGSCACGKRGADVRPDFNWNRKPEPAMGYRRV
jgi:hypothetical protein